MDLAAEVAADGDGAARVADPDLGAVFGVAEHLGSDTFLHVDLDGGTHVIARAAGEIPVDHGDRIWLTPQDGRIYRFGADGLAA